MSGSIIEELSEKEVETIKETWKIPSENLHDSAELIFYTFLERHPKYMQVFPAFRTRLLKELKGTPRFRAHSSRIFNVLGSVVDSIQADSSNYEVKMFLAEYGVSHARRKIQREPYEDLRVVVMEILTEVCQLDEEGVVAWQKFFNLVFGVFFECMDGSIDQFMY